MRFLSFSQPWLWAVLRAGKLVENRTWAPPISMIDQRFALHAAKSWDDAGPGFFLRHQIDAPGSFASYQRSAVVGVATIDRVVTTARTLPPELARWYMGPLTPDGRTVYGWILRDVIELPRPIPMKGGQGLRNLAPAIEAAVLDQLLEVEAARAAAASAAVGRSDG